MRLSTTTNSSVWRKIGFPDTVRMIARAGFDAYDINLFNLGDGNALDGDDWREGVAQIRAAAKESGIVCNQAHAPFVSSKKPNGFGAHPAELFDRHLRSFEIASALGARDIVVHVANYFPKGEDAFGYNVAYYKKLEPYARDLGIRIAIENLFLTDHRSECNRPDDSAATPEDLLRYLDALDSDVFTVCLDVGHAGLVGDDAERFLQVLGNRVGALHIHDNDFVDDWHTLPFLGKLDWESLAKALADADYPGDFTFEVLAPFCRLPTELMEDLYRYMARIGRYLIARVDSYR